MKPILTHPSWSQIDKACALLANKVLKDGFNPDTIVGLARGGLVPAVIMSHILEVKMFPISYSSKVGNGEYKQYENTLPYIPGKNILLVDDIIDSGHTMQEIYYHYYPHYTVKIASLYWKEGAAIEPHYYWQSIPKDSDWIIFSWEI